MGLFSSDPVLDPSLEKFVDPGDAKGRKALARNSDDVLRLLADDEELILATANHGVSAETPPLNAVVLATTKRLLVVHKGRVHREIRRDTFDRVGVVPSKMRGGYRFVATCRKPLTAIMVDFTEQSLALKFARALGYEP